MSKRNAADMTMSELDAEAMRLDSLLSQQAASIDETRRQLAIVRAELDRRSRGAAEPRISDHAVLRFMERGMGFDIDALRRRLLNDTVKAAMKAGAKTVTVEGVRLVVQGNVITTVLDVPAKKFRPAPRTRDPETEQAMIQAGLAEHFEELAEAVV